MLSFNLSYTLLPVANKPLKITGARENNLKNISFEIDHDELVVVTGLSGSGKSSLAFDTVYAEGQRRYIETFSPYVRQFLDKVKRPLIDTAESVRPAIAIQQRTRVLSSRSTVGSMTNVNDYLKLVWAGFGEPVCSDCATPIKVWKSSAVAALALSLSQAAQTVLIAAKFDFTGRPFAGEKERLKSLGYSRLYDEALGAVVALEDATLQNLTVQKRLILVIDRLKADAPTSAVKRIAESIEQAFIVTTSCTLIADGKLNDYSNLPICSSCGKKVAKARPALFSFNHPLGACPDCKGFGKLLAIDADKLVPNPMLSIKEGALACWNGDAAAGQRRKLNAFCATNNISTAIAWIKLSEEQRALILNSKSKEYRGVMPWFKALESKAYKMHVRVFLAKYRTAVNCSTCNGLRFNKDALAYLIEGRTIAQAMQSPVGELLVWLGAYYDEKKRSLPRQVRDMFQATLARLKYLVDLGVEYLTLERQSRTLSGGETQRVNLSTALGSELTSTHFVLDEPSVGLHARDTERLIGAVQALHKIGNSVMLVEHDLDVIMGGTQVLEVGPGAGVEGGEITYLGATKDWPGIDMQRAMPNIFNANFQNGITAAKTPEKFLVVENACARNLKNLSFKIPLNRFVCLTGVSGSGKSSFVSEVLMRAAYLHKIGMAQEGPHNLVTGFDNLDEVLFVDQAPLAKSPRANIATYTGMWDRVRDLLASTNAASSLALSKSAFSFNVDGGRCPHCSGAGFIREDMQFLSDVYIPCEHCLGQRFQDHVLSVKYKDKNAHELLGLTVDEAVGFFEKDSIIAGPAKTLSLLGLGHLTLGHSLSELSGGEAQRLKLVPYLQKKTGHNLFIFDEPTTGLHPYDVKKLVTLFETVRDQGHSVLCIEHNLQLMLATDWLIDLGPEGGEGGGQLMLEGCVTEFLKKENETKSQTSFYLKRFSDEARGATRKSTATMRAQSLSPKSAAKQSIDIYGARHHNLKNVNVSVPLEKLVALTGVSGSGKSSIAKDIIYAEGQRRYLDCLSPYARQFVQELTRPDIDHIDNVKPAICVYQHTFQPGRLSTVGTMSESYNFLRLLFAKVGVQHCPDHPKERIAPLSALEIVTELKKLSVPQVRLLAPIIKQKKGTHREVLARAVAAEISQVRVDGVFLNPQSVSMEGGLQKTKVHSIDYVLGKFNPTTVPQDLAEEVVKQGLSLSGGTLIALSGSGSTSSEVIFSTDRTCHVCKRGFFKPDPEDLSFHSTRGRCEKCGGTGKNVKWQKCSSCEGTRLNVLGRNVRLNGFTIADLAEKNADELQIMLEALTWTNHERAIALPILRELLARLKTVSEVGLEYLPLNRDCATLSGGELQRLRLAAAMGSPLTGTVYIFDEPSAGLHPQDNERVLRRISSVCERGNSVIIIEHDPETISACEYVIEVGPGGGRNGGEIIFSDTVKKMQDEGQTATALALRARYPAFDSSPSAESLKVDSPGLHCVKPLSITVPLRQLVTVCGVSGAGKSTFVHSILAKTVIEGVETKGVISLGEHRVKTSLPIERVVYVDQQPIGANSRSTPASYLKIFDEIRKIFALSLEAKARGFEPSHFSYNTGKGRCAECGGLGVIKLEMNFLPDAAVVCETCRGRRYKDEVESILYQGISIADALKLTFEEARSRFANHRKILGPVRLACDLGLGYLALGQPSTTLSGGECQRIKLVSELWAAREGHSLYVLDEPTTGLHKSDVALLMKALRELIVRGNSVILIEHDPEVLLSSDYLIEFGPQAGGGEVVFSGTPKKLIEMHPNTPWGSIIQRYTEENESTLDEPIALGAQ